MERAYLTKHNDVCRRCKGDGVIAIEGVHLGHGKYSDATEKVCDLCKGSGLVQIEKKIDVTITPKINMPYAKK